jgi:Mycolic acid cyclopropane synthetase
MNLNFVMAARRRLMLGAGIALLSGALLAQDDFGQTPYVPTPQNIVDQMLEVAKVSARDYLIDLGSGDGRMIITAAKKYGARGFGVDLDRRLVIRANQLAAKAGVADRAVFYERDLYDTDLTAATVVTIYLLPEVNLMVRPKLLATLKPGTRVVSHDYGMGDWPPDQQMVLDAPDKPVGREKTSKVFYWVVPGNAAGKWRWQLPLAGKAADFEFFVSQNFQAIKGRLVVDGGEWLLENLKLQGEEVSFSALDKAGGTRYEFSGTIYNHALTGTVRTVGLAPQALAWNAVRTELGTPAHALLKKPDIVDLKQQMQ